MIEVSGITKCFGTKTVLEGITFRVAPGQIVGIIGRSGVGKTTLLRCMNGLLPLDAGQVSVGDDVLGPGQDRSNGTGIRIRRQIGMVFQQLNLWPYKTVLENLTEGPLRVKRAARAETIGRAEMWARRFGIEDQLNKFPNRLSGGQRQRVAIARALMMEPQFLLLDEITSALDPVLAGEIVEAIVGLKGQGIGIVIVSHQIEFIRRHGDVLHFLHGGRFAESGNPQVILSGPETSELRVFINSIHDGW